MSAPPPSDQRQVSLRGASAKEMTRDALLEKLAQERQLRSHQRRASAAALCIQKTWRRYSVIKKVSDELQEEWEAAANHQNKDMTRSWISNSLLRPFLFFITKSSVLRTKMRTKNLKCMSRCFSILLQSINSAEAEKNCCSLAVGKPMEKSTWLYQAQKLISLPISMLVKCDKTSLKADIVAVVALGMRLAVCLTDPKAWKSLRAEEAGDADISVKRLIEYMITNKINIYNCLRIYILKNGSRSISQSRNITLSENNLLIMASAITLALRPFHLEKSYKGDVEIVDVDNASRCYSRFILTIPCLTQRLPSVLLPALKHEQVLLPCLSNLLISEPGYNCHDSMLLVARNDILGEIYDPDNLKALNQRLKLIPSPGWALANIIDLAIEHNNNSGSSECFVKNLDYRLYICAANCISEYFVNWLDENVELVNKDTDDTFLSDECFLKVDNTDDHGNVKSSFIDLLKPVHQQWHLLKLLNIAKNNIPVGTSKHISECAGYFNLLDVVCFYSYMLRIFSHLNPVVGSLHILNMLSFTPGFLVELWEALEASFFNKTMPQEDDIYKNTIIENQHEAMLNPRQKESIKESGSKWANVLQKIAGKSNDNGHSCITEKYSPVEVDEDTYDFWDINAMKQGSEGISKDLLVMLYLFSATYAHLLLVMDDIEFYEKQVLFTLQQQQRVAAVLNTFVYNSFAQNSGHGNKFLLHAAVKCLQLLYERDCRHRFCPSWLWLAPARKSHITIVAAARAHEAAFLNTRSAEPASITALSSVLTIVPHVYPFEERVEMFREFIKRDKASRGLAGETSEPAAELIEIVIRRSHIIEDGYKQLNSLGPRLKSCISVSFVSECGLPEAGLDYGGLSKELLTDLSKAIFDPEYGLFSQTSTSENSLVPNVAARMLENGIDMMEFLGRLVGKALYEGILLDYSFSLVFVQKLLGRYSFLDELSTLDPELYKNLMYVKNFDGDVADLFLDFTVTEELCGRNVVAELKPGGRNISVTNENKLQYVHAMADYKLNRQILPFANAFYRGLIDLVSPSWLSLFNANEFNQLLSGGKHDFNVDDLRSHTKYSGGYSETSRTVKIFWEVVRGFKPSERCMLLKFVTSCSRAPLLGFKHLQPTFTIHKVACDVPIWASIGGQDVDRLPSASTCYNTLKLPTYKRSSTLRNKLLYAISSNTGFELS